jgi:hypothetical protein
MLSLASFAIASTACAGFGTPSPSQRWRPIDVVDAPRVSSIALLSALHPADSMTRHADSLITAMLTTSCPGVTVHDARSTETRLEQRGVIVPRRMNATFAREARDVLRTDLLLSPTVLGVLRGDRGKWTTLREQILEDYEDESAGLVFEGWDLRSSRPAVRVIRSRSSVVNNTVNPLELFEFSAQQAVTAVAALCRADVSPVIGAPSGRP